MIGAVDGPSFTHRSRAPRRGHISSTVPVSRIQTPCPAILGNPGLNTANHGGPGRSEKRRRRGGLEGREKGGRGVDLDLAAEQSHLVGFSADPPRGRALVLSLSISLTVLALTNRGCAVPATRHATPWKSRKTRRRRERAVTRASGRCSPCENARDTDGAPATGGRVRTIHRHTPDPRAGRRRGTGQYLFNGAHVSVCSPGISHRERAALLASFLRIRRSVPPGFAFSTGFGAGRRQSPSLAWLC